MLYTNFYTTKVMLTTLKPNVCKSQIKMDWIVMTWFKIFCKVY